MARILLYEGLPHASILTYMAWVLHITSVPPVFQVPFPACVRYFDCYYAGLALPLADSVAEEVP